MVPQLWLYLRYWWNKVNVSSAMITFDILYHHQHGSSIVDVLTCINSVQTSDEVVTYGGVFVYPKTILKVVIFNCPVWPDSGWFTWRATGPLLRQTGLWPDRRTYSMVVLHFTWPLPRQTGFVTRHDTQHGGTHWVIVWYKMTASISPLSLPCVIVCQMLQWCTKI